MPHHRFEGRAMFKMIRCWCVNQTANLWHLQISRGLADHLQMRSSYPGLGHHVSCLCASVWPGAAGPSGTGGLSVCGISASSLA